MEDKKPQKSKSREYYMFAFRIMGDFGASIAIPVVLLVLMGQYLDERYGKSPLFTIIGFVLAALVSAKIIYKKAKIYGEEYKRLGEKKEENTQK